MLALLVQFASCTVDQTPSVDPTQSGSAQETGPQISVGDPPTLNYYQNPIIASNDENAKPNNGVGDPFVMRYNGKYYLYCSSAGFAVLCWVSDDLVNWEYAGYCATGSKFKGAYAPEVVYYNGAFYMYASPMGNGHYIYKSDSPTGPFEVVSDNLGLGIDGHVFIDDDGSWHFYRAYDTGIAVYDMDAPNSINADSQSLIKLDMFDNRYCWTEGPMVVKYDDTYYLTYAGNHVWSAAYRINYAISKDSPTKFTTVDNNPLLLSTNKNTVMGIGHSSTVLGPNLDEYYIVYHSFKTMGIRDMNIDRIVFNGTGTVSLGPTVTQQQVPLMPDIYNHFEKDSDLSGWDITNGAAGENGMVLSAGGKLMSQNKVGDGGNYTAEYNIKYLTKSAGIIFGYTDEQNYGKAIYNADTCELTVTITVNGNESKSVVPVKASFGENINNNALNTFKVQKSGDEYVIFLNGRNVFETQSQLGGGIIGVICEDGEAGVGFVGATNGALQSTLKDVYKSAETTIPAFTCNESATVVEYDGAKYLQMLKGRQYGYNVNVDNDGKYDLVLNYRASSDCVIEVYQGTGKVGEISLGATDNSTMRVTRRGMNLTKGAGLVTLYVKEGNADVLDLSFHASEDVTEVTYDFSSSSSIKPYHNFDKWRIKNGVLNFDAEYGKYMVGSENWGDYIVEADITPTSDDINAGLCFRVSNPASFEDGNKEKYFGGTYYMQGYYVGLTNDSVVLAKLNYDWQELQTVKLDVKKDTAYKIRVEVKDNNMKILIDGVEIFNYTDNDAPFLHGMVGFRAHESHVTADNLTISPIK